MGWVLLSLFPILSLLLIRELPLCLFVPSVYNDNSVPIRTWFHTSYQQLVHKCWSDWVFRSLYWLSTHNIVTDVSFHQNFHDRRDNQSRFVFFIFPGDTSKSLNSPPNKCQNTGSLIYAGYKYTPASPSCRDLIELSTQFKFKLVFRCAL